MESKMSLLDNIQVGQVVTVSFDLQGSEITEPNGQVKYFVHVRPYKIDVRQAQQPNNQPQPPQPQYQQPTRPAYQPPQVEDDTPF